MKELSKMLKLTAEKFADKLDKGGKPYFLHCLRVMNNVTQNENTMCAALGHDLLEDCPEIDVFELLKMGFNKRIVQLIQILTHHKETETYEDYIKRISLDATASEIKLADLRDNSDITRLKGLTKKDIDRLEKYHRAYVYLSKR